MTYKKRMYSNVNMERFVSTMESKDWEHVMSESDAQRAYSMFYNDFNEAYNICFPMKTYKYGYRTRKPWLSEGMKQSIKIKNKLYRKSKKSANPEHELQYKRYRNKLNKLLLDAERTHYNDLLNENKNNMKKSWRILKEIINKKKDSKSCSRFQMNGSYATD